MAVVGRYLTLKDMTRGSGCTPRTVRYYERQGLLRAQRSAGGHRLFDRAELERLNFIISLREAGWALEDVVSFLDMREDAADDREACGKLETLIAQQIGRLEQKIEVLTRLREDLRSTATLLPVCGECTEERLQVECEACDRVPTLDELPRSFRLVWRSKELAGPHIFDERHADGEDVDDEDDDAAATGTTSR